MALRAGADGGYGQVQGDMTANGSLDGKLIVLIGGSGFFGSAVAQKLLSRGARLRVCSRRPEKAYALRPLANLGQIQLARCDVTRPDSIAAVMRGADAAVYLVGAFKGNLDAVQARGAGFAAEAAQREGAGAFVNISAIGADAASPVDYARTKAEGENFVRAEFPRATILRSSVLFAEDDEFINMFAKLIAKLPVLPIFGPDAKMQPLFVDDAAEAVANALADPQAHGGETYEIAGPEPLTMRAINRRIAAAQGRNRQFIELPDAVSGLFARATGWLPGAPLSNDQWELLKAGSVPSGSYPGIDHLGVTPRPLGLFLDRWMVRFCRFGRFGTKTTAVRR